MFSDSFLSAGDFNLPAVHVVDSGRRKIPVRMTFSLSLTLGPSVGRLVVGRYLHVGVYFSEPINRSSQFEATLGAASGCTCPAMTLVGTYQLVHHVCWCEEPERQIASALTSGKSWQQRSSVCHFLFERNSTQSKPISHFVNLP